jgi:hypothetical protein
MCPNYAYDSAKTKIPFDYPSICAFTWMCPNYAFSTMNIFIVHSIINNIKCVYSLPIYLFIRGVERLGAR